jgi:hypothetical protein
MGLQEEYKAALIEFIQKQVDAATSHTEAFRVRRQMQDHYGQHFVKNVKYKGADIVDDNLTFDDNGLVRNHTCVAWYPSRSRNAVRGGTNLNMWSLNKAPLIVTGYKSEGVASAYKQRIKQYANNHGISLSYNDGPVYLVSGDRLPGGVWTEGFDTVSWTTIMAETKAARKSSGGGFSYDGAYDVYDPDTGYYEVTNLEKDDDIVFYAPTWHSIDSSLAKRMTAIYPDLRIVSAKANRHNKLAREYPNARMFDRSYWYTLIAEEDFDKLTADDLEALKVKNIYSRTARYYYRDEYGVGSSNAFREVDKIDDPEYARVIALFNRKVTAGDYYAFDSRYKAMEKQWEKEKPVVFSDRYPLINWDQKSKDTLAYVNMMYAATKEGN